jgi:NADH-ubiquinone oxidoreductase chain 1
MINSLLEALIVIGPLLGSIAYVTITEHKIMGSMQRRIGPNKVGYYPNFFITH